jgi:hypothetical protein
LGQALLGWSSGDGVIGASAFGAGEVVLVGAEDVGAVVKEEEVDESVSGWWMMKQWMDSVGSCNVATRNRPTSNNLCRQRQKSIPSEAQCSSFVVIVTIVYIKIKWRQCSTDADEISSFGGNKISSLDTILNSQIQFILIGERGARGIAIGRYLNLRKILSLLNEVTENHYGRHCL